MKKKIITVLVGLSFILIAIFAINYYIQNKISKEDFILSGNYISQQMDNQAVFDSTLYYTEKGNLKAIDTQAKTRFDIKLDQGFEKILYGKIIYISYPNKIQAINRHNGKIIKQVEFEDEVLNIELIDENLYAYFEDSYRFLGKKLNKNKLYEYQGQPTAMSHQGSKRAVNILESVKGNLNSRIIITDKDQEIFNINTAEEVFLFNRILNNGKVILVSNRYIYLIDGSSIENKVFIKNPKAIDFRDDQLQIIDFDKLRIFDPSLEEIEAISISDQIEEIQILDTSTVAYYSNKIYVYQNATLMDTELDSNHKIYKDPYGLYLFTGERVERIKAY